MFEKLSTLLDKTTFRLRDKVALLFIRKGKIESRMTYSSLRRVSSKVANGLMGMGLEKGDRVILFMPKCMELVILHLAVQKIGGISVILNPGFKKDEMEYFIKDTEPRLILTGKREEGLVRSIDPNRLTLSIETETPFTEEKLFPSSSSEISYGNANPEDPALLIYTSGTTGQPKGAILTQKNLLTDAQNIIQTWEISENDVLCHALPLFHIHGLCFALHTSLMAGAKIILIDEFSSETVMDILSTKEGELACSMFMGVPTMYNKLMERKKMEGKDFSHIRLFACGSAPLNPKDFCRIKKFFGKEPVEREGMSETGMNFSNPLHGPKKPGSIGLPLPQVEVRIVNPVTLVDLKPGEVGEIWLRGPNVTPGYWRKPLETEAVFSDGWFRTGDLGKRDEDGYYYITDRIKHIIISGGENISPKEIESVLDQHPNILESCVVGIPDEKWGERVVAALVLKPGCVSTENEIKDYCKRHLLDWKCPRELLFLNELPRNRMGKVLKEKVVELFLSHSNLKGKDSPVL